MYRYILSITLVFGHLVPVILALATPKKSSQERKVFSSRWFALSEKTVPIGMGLSRVIHICVPVAALIDQDEREMTPEPSYSRRSRKQMSRRETN